MKGRITNMGHGLEGDLTVTLSLPRQYTDNIKKLLDAEIDAEIKKWREKRSLSANAYAWGLITQIAQSMTPPMNKEEVYVEMLKRYGQGGFISIQADKASDVTRAFDYYVQKGEGEVNGKNFLHYMVYIGSSKYNTKEMSVFISGIVEEAKDLGIETLTPQELERMKGEWA
ncbi:MAG: hypothetical protein PHX74_09395 [Candidatus Sumerlaeales bacterium]|nr:hypothetical protein [Candidatus Sumerlaeales bacterium]